MCRKFLLLIALAMLLLCNFCMTLPEAHAGNAGQCVYFWSRGYVLIVSGMSTNQPYFSEQECKQAQQESIELEPLQIPEVIFAIKG